MQLSLALDRYDRHFPFFDGTVQPPPGVTLKTYQVGQSVELRDGQSRHERMLHGQEFDLCEFSMSSYLMAFDRKQPITGIPVFPRRLFHALVQEFQKECELLTIWKDGRVLAGVLTLLYEDQALPYYGGALREAFPYAINDFMYWELM